MMSSRSDRRGFTMVELIVAIVVSAVVLAAATMLLKNNQRFYRSQSQVSDVQSNIRAVALILPAELREISARGGDILAMSDTSITIRAMRGLGVACSIDSGNARLTLKGSLWFGYRAIDPTRDGMIIFRDADTSIASDDSWLRADIVSTDSQNCPDGTSGTRVRLSNIQGVATNLGRVYAGAPTRTYEMVRYHLFRDAGNISWLGVSTYASGSWTASSPVAGPLLARGGLRFNYLSSAGAATTDSSQVASIEVTVRGESAQPIYMQGRPQGLYRDSLMVVVAPRGN